MRKRLAEILAIINTVCFMLVASVLSGACFLDNNQWLISIAVVMFIVALIVVIVAGREVDLLQHILAGDIGTLLGAYALGIIIMGVCVFPVQSIMSIDNTYTAVLTGMYIFAFLTLAGILASATANAASRG